MTAIFTPGYAAAEQFTSAKQGPWTDIYGLAATLYHAITGRTPPSAIDRVIEDTCRVRSPARRRRASTGNSCSASTPGWRLPQDQRPPGIAAWASALLGEEPRRQRTHADHGAGGTHTARAAQRADHALCLSPIRHASWVAGARRGCRPDGDGRRLHLLRSRADTPGGARGIPVGQRDACVRGGGGSGVEPLDDGPSGASQIALSAQGFDTRGSDGTFGPRSREMIAAWQQAQKASRRRAT